MGRYDSDHSTDASRESALYDAPVYPSTLAEEKSMGGWTHNTKPLGGDPMELITAGSGDDDNEGSATG